jgi:hypothetical protein
LQGRYEIKPEIEPSLFRWPDSPSLPTLQSRRDPTRIGQPYERLLQDLRVDPSADNNLAVQWAAQYGQLAVVDRLLEDDRVDVAVAIQWSRPENRKRFECRERLTEICIALQDLALPAWVTVQILDAARPWSTLPLHSKWNLVCAVKHFHDKHPAQ